MRVRRLILSKRIGDGKTPETAWRPAIADRLQRCLAIELDDGNFLVATDDAASKLPAGDSKVKSADASDLLHEKLQSVRGKAVRLGHLRIDVPTELVVD
ncbi:unnamed protein product [marine sediment metagenome]|uniref:Uncharacterized protein n=1 Tax=marine sediment metagenome TaxID=412755 RepID=X1JWX1_9ZZZZ